MEIFDFRCKYCGGELHEVDGAKSVAKCKYCGSKQTLPKLYSEKRANFFSRANHLRRNNEFDRAEMLYEQILNEDPTDPEAYWLLVLCRFGIEYVEDVWTKELKPTVNRTQLTSIFADEDYKSAIKYANDEQRELYKKEAEVISEIQKGILEISQKEAPFDVFICYKETDENGRRSKDSVLAHDLYRELIRDGYKVFFARETLSDKIGTAYEPYIFSALNSSKVMVVLGTKREHFEAVWVRNEWSRFLGQIKSGERKTLIPVYKDMDAYLLPPEFANLQALNMDRIGYLQELISGVENIVRISRRRDNYAREDEEQRLAKQEAPKNAPKPEKPPKPEKVKEPKPEKSPKAEKIKEPKPEKPPKVKKVKEPKVKEDYEDKKRKKYPVIIVVTALILAAAIGIGVFVVLNRETPDDNPQASIPSTENDKIGFITDVFPEPSDDTETPIDNAPANQSKLEFILNDDGKSYSVSGTINQMIISAVIPSTYNGKPVTAIGDNAFKNCIELSSVTIPNSITSIGDGAFWKCARLTSITIPESVTTIDDYAFYQCTTLTDIHFGGSKAKWDAMTKGRNWDYSMGEYTLHLKNQTVTPVSKLAFSLNGDAKSYSVSGIGTETATDIVIPSTYNGRPVTAINEDAFKQSSTLTSVVIPSSITSIGRNAFRYCEKLTSVTISGGVKDIHYNAFSDCPALESVTINEGVENIWDAAFAACNNLRSISLPKSLKILSGYALFECRNLTEINFNGTIAEWNALEKGTAWNSNVGSYFGSYTVHCTDGDTK